jgi:hypothetical protein
MRATVDGVCFARDKTQLQFSHQQKKEFFFKSVWHFFLSHSHPIFQLLGCWRKLEEGNYYYLMKKVFELIFFSRLQDN